MRWSISRSRLFRSSCMSQFTWGFVGEALDGKGKIVKGNGKQERSKEEREELNEESRK